MEMAKYILSVLKTNLMVFYSWGSHNFYALNNGLQFNVQGFLFKGKVRITYNEGSDLFTVEFVKRTKVAKSFTDVYVDSLIDLIDREVEYGDYYKKTV